MQNEGAQPPSGKTLKIHFGYFHTAEAWRGDDGIAISTNNFTYTFKGAGKVNDGNLATTRGQNETNLESNQFFMKLDLQGTNNSSEMITIGDKIGENSDIKYLLS